MTIEIVVSHSTVVAERWLEVGGEAGEEGGDADGEEDSGFIHPSSWQVAASTKAAVIRTRNIVHLLHFDWVR